VTLPLNFEEKLGEGAAASVYKYLVHGKFAAVKVLKIQLIKIKVLRIIEKLRRIKNCNVVRLCGYSIRPTAFIYELCTLHIDGEVFTNVSQYMQFFNELQIFNLWQRLDIIQQATNGLRALHDVGIVHRDFKPSNLLVAGTENNVVVKVSDFDDIFMCKNTIMSTLTQGIPFKGMTLTYMAPEICEGLVKCANTDCDIYSWALSVYEILAGVSSPWEKILPILSDTLLLQAIKENERPDINTFIDLYEDESVHKVASIILSSWSSNPRERPPANKV